MNTAIFERWGAQPGGRWFKSNPRYQVLKLKSPRNLREIGGLFIFANNDFRQPLFHDWVTPSCQNLRRQLLVIPAQRENRYQAYQALSELNRRLTLSIMPYNK